MKLINLTAARNNVTTYRALTGDATATLPTTWDATTAVQVSSKLRANLIDPMKLYTGGVTGTR